MKRRLLAMINPFHSRVTQVLGINARNQQLVYRYNQRKHFPLADDKLRTKKILEAEGISVPGTFHVFSWMHEVKTVGQVLDGRSDFVIKPSRGKAGSGILVIVDRNSKGWVDAGGHVWNEANLKRHIGNIIFGNYAHGLEDRAIVEERLIQGPMFDHELFPGLPDIRVITLKGEPLMAMLRLPTSHSGGKANLHQGAIGVGVDLQTGRTNHASFKGKSIARHPDTGAELCGRLLNHWADILLTARAAARVLPLGYLGIDIAIDEKRGPVILEANVRPGLEIQNANRQGLRPLVDAATAKAVLS
jgi:alpha-L-glutamate ligase-like protein